MRSKIVEFGLLFKYTHRRFPAQDFQFTLILWYVKKSYFVGIKPLLD